MQLGKSLGFKPYSADDVDEPTIPLPRTIDTSVLSSVDQIDVIWFNEFNFPKYAFEIEYTSGVDRGIQRLFQLRHYQDCKLFIVVQKQGQNMDAYKKRFNKLVESDPYNQIPDRFSLITDSDIRKMKKKALELDRLRSRILEWELHEDVARLIPNTHEVEEEIEEVPSWVSKGKANWSRHFTTQRRYARDLFSKLGEKLMKSSLKLDARILKWHISIYKGGTMVAVVYPRKDKLIFLLKGVEDRYSEAGLETVEKPDTDYIIISATKYLLVKSEKDFDGIIRLLKIAVESLK